MMQITEAAKQIIIINVLFFVGTYFIGSIPAYDALALHSPLSGDFKVWQLVTHMFMHGGINHILFNMLGVWMFGSALEHFWGTNKFVFFYISCGLGAAIIHLGVNYLQLQHILEGASDLDLSFTTLKEILSVQFTSGDHYSGELFQNQITPILKSAGKLQLLNENNFTSLFEAATFVNTPMLGASGALYGLIVAYAFMFPNAEMIMIFFPIPIKAKYFVPLLIFGDLFLGLRGQSIFGSHWDDGIAHFAHLGGALVGFIMMWYWRNKRFKHNRWN